MATALTGRILDILQGCPYGLTASEVAGRLGVPLSANCGTLRNNQPAAATLAAERIFEHACELGFEGIVSRHRERAYRSGSSKSWLKGEESDEPAAVRLDDGR